MNEQAPLSRQVAGRAVLNCMGTTAQLLAHRRLHLPQQHVGLRLNFADGTSARVYRETVVDRGPTVDACVLMVEFRLRFVRGWGHTLFRWESLLNTPLFAGFPDLVSKLWLAHDQHDVYRGLYEWDGPGRAECYARCLWQVLALGSVGAKRGRGLVAARRRRVSRAAGQRSIAQRARVSAWHTTLTAGSANGCVHAHRQRHVRPDRGRAARRTAPG